MHDNNVSHSAACFVRDNAANDTFNLWDQYFDRKYNVFIQHVVLHVVNGKYPVNEKINNSYIYISKDTCDGSCQYTIYSV